MQRRGIDFVDPVLGESQKKSLLTSFDFGFLHFKQLNQAWLLKMQKAQRFAPGFLLQRRRDSNPRNLSVQRFSRPPRSTTLPLLYENESFSRPPLPIAIGTTTLPLLYVIRSFTDCKCRWIAGICKKEKGKN